MRDFTIRSNTNGLGLRSNAIKDLCPLIFYQLVVGWIGKTHSPTRTTSGTIKINMLQTQILQLVAAVARDDRGEILKAWAKKQEYCDAFEAEAAAFTWALKLASLGGY